MPTPKEAIYKTMRVLLNDEDSNLMDDDEIFRLGFNRLSRQAQELIANFLISQTTIPTDEELEKLRMAVLELLGKSDKSGAKFNQLRKKAYISKRRR